MQKGYSWNPSTCVFENSKYLRSIGNISVIEFDEIIFVMDVLSTKMTNNIEANVTSTA